ncbi:hypothetical protein [Paenibacillus pini]|uniref:Uncharacterized protein n=1 Tax=Paenibacillus pini JCM 16418 TaxID=1236976 RepID=W7Z090_9BACL|nr:hypothetical protein [Paenibacillus pini]GAF08034.1 hypothetical protein JCM16418_2071 [Paenibacillus pini JCM 16418]
MLAYIYTLEDGRIIDFVPDVISIVSDQINGATLCIGGIDLNKFSIFVTDEKFELNQVIPAGAVNHRSKFTGCSQEEIQADLKNRLADIEIAMSKMFG